MAPNLHDLIVRFHENAVPIGHQVCSRQGATGIQNYVYLYLYLTVRRFQVIADYWSFFFAFDTGTSRLG